MGEPGNEPETRSQCRAAERGGQREGSWGEIWELDAMTCVSRGERSEDLGVAKTAGERVPATVACLCNGCDTLCTERSRMEKEFQKQVQSANILHGVKNIGHL